MQKSEIFAFHESHEIPAGRKGKKVLGLQNGAIIYFGQIAMKTCLIDSSNHLTLDETAVQTKRARARARVRAREGGRRETLGWTGR